MRLSAVVFNYKLFNCHLSVMTSLLHAVLFKNWLTMLSVASIPIQGGPKNRTCLSVDNSAMVDARKTCDTSKVSECCKE